MATVGRTVLVGLEYGKKAIRFRSVNFNGGMLDLKLAILDRFQDVAGVEKMGPDNLIIHVKREEFGGEFEEVELESDIPDKSVLKAVVEVCSVEYDFVKKYMIDIFIQECSVAPQPSMNSSSRQGTPTTSEPTTTEPISATSRTSVNMSARTSGDGLSQMRLTFSQDSLTVRRPTTEVRST